MDVMAPPLEAGSQTPAIDLRLLTGVLLRRWKLLATVPLFAMIATYGIMRKVPSIYRSSVEILVFNPQRQIDDSVLKLGTPFEVDASAISTEMAVMRSKSVALAAVKKLGLEKDSEFLRRSRLSVWLERFGLPDVSWFRALLGGSDRAKQTTGEPGSLRASLEDDAAEQLRRHLEVDRIFYSYVLTLSATSQDPEKARRIAATVADVYLSTERDARLEALQRVASWLKSRLEDLRSRIVETESAMEKLKAASGLSDAGEKGNLLEQQIAALNSQLMSARAEVTEKRASLDQARRVAENGDVLQIPQMMPSEIISQLRVQQLALRQREGELAGRVSEHHSELLAVRAQLAGINKALSTEADRILGKMQNDYDTAVLHQQTLERNLQRVTSEHGNSTDYITLQQLQRLADADRKLYTNYSSQFNEVTTRQTLQDAGARIITPATFPEAPAGPRRAMISAFSGAFGLVVTVLLVFLAEYFRGGVKTSAEVERTFGYPIVGMIPLVQSWVRSGQAHEINDIPQGLLDQAATTIRLGVKFAAPDRAPKILLVTSAIPGEGKSSAALLLAMSSAASGQKAVLLDCDFRHPSLSRAFGNPQIGMSDILMSRAEISDVAIKVGATGTYLIPAGSAADSPADLLSSEQMRSVIGRLRESYEYVVIDSSPLLPVVDALGIARLADKIIVIVEWARTPRQVVSEAVKLLRPQSDRIAGIVLNKVDFKQLSRYDYLANYNYIPRPRVTAK
jgi:polysaccharide biosynthesis transport protein